MDLRTVQTSALHGPVIRRLVLSAMVAVLIALPLLFSGPAPTVEAAKPSSLIPFLNVVLGWRSRNRVYRTVNPFIDEKRAYYDALHAKALEQLAAREVGGLRESQVAAFVKVAALIEREREATIDFAESEKKAARDQFIEIVQTEINTRMLASTPATRVLGALTDGVRTSRGLIDRALDKLTGGGSGALADIQRARRIASRVTVVGQLIGGKLGEGLRAAGGRVVALIDEPTGDIEAGLTQAREELGELGALVEDLQAQGYRPTATEVGQDVLVALITGKEAGPAVQAIVDMLVARSGREGDFRERARAAIVGDAAARCAVKAQQIRQVVLRLEMDVGDGDGGDDESDLPVCQVIDLGGQSEPIAAAPTARPTAAPTEAAPDPTLAPTEAPSPTPVPAATRPAFQDLDPCAVMPPGGRPGDVAESSCFATFSSETRGRIVQTFLIWPHLTSEDVCQKRSENGDTMTVIESVPFGECGYRIDVHYLGQKTGSYSGWQISFILDRFEVRVATKDEYPANRDWIEATAAEIEANIRVYLALDGGD
jgi:hypothetical protein